MKATQSQIESMIRLYTIDRKNTRVIGKELGVSDVTVQSYLKKVGITLSPQKYKFNENYFNEIDTPNKAYFLGFIYADGCVFPPKNSCAIKLTREDDYILEQFKQELGSTKPLTYTKSKPIVGTQYVGKAQSKIEINSKTMVADLQRLGVTQNKSLMLKFPEKMMFMKDFIRGYFDGDGCIYNSQGRIMLNFVGSENFCKGLCEFLRASLDINVVAKQEKRGNSWYVYVLRIGDVLKFCNYIYQDRNCIKLNRKFEKFENYLKEKKLL